MVFMRRRGNGSHTHGHAGGVLQGQKNPLVNSGSATGQCGSTWYRRMKDKF